MKHRGRFLTLCLLVVVAAVMSAACTEDQPNSPSPVIVNVNNTNTNTISGGNPATQPSPGSVTKPDTVGVGFFGGVCPSGSGKTPPGNGGTQLPVGCTGFLTATPKKNGVPMSPAEHGPTITWTDPAPAGVVTSVTASNDFNRDITALAQGTFSLCATVQAVTGCFHGTVTP